MVAHPRAQSREKSFQARRHNFLDLCSKIRTGTRKRHSFAVETNWSPFQISLDRLFPFFLPPRRTKFSLPLFRVSRSPSSYALSLPRLVARKFRSLIRFFVRPRGSEVRMSEERKREIKDGMKMLNSIIDAFPVFVVQFQSSSPWNEFGVSV